VHADLYELSRRVGPHRFEFTLEVFAHGWKTTSQFNRFCSERKDFGRVENHAEPVFG
jgi:hypothetical protein